MIELTREEAISILKAISQVDGYLMAIKDTGCIGELMDYPVELLSDKLKGGEK